VHFYSKLDITGQPRGDFPLDQLNHIHSGEFFTPFRPHIAGHKAAFAGIKRPSANTM
jgi:hypothetical protein